MIALGAIGGIICAACLGAQHYLLRKQAREISELRGEAIPSDEDIEKLIPQQESVFKSESVFTVIPGGKTE